MKELQERIQAVLDYVATIDCSNCDHPSSAHDNGPCSALSVFALNHGKPCGCDWGASNVTEDVRRLLAEPAGHAQPGALSDLIAKIRVEIDRDDHLANGEDEQAHNQRHWPDRIERQAGVFRELLDIAVADLRAADETPTDARFAYAAGNARDTIYGLAYIYDMPEASFTAPAETKIPTATCGVCGQQRALDDPPPTVTNVQVGTTADGKAMVRPTLSKPIRHDPETGAICWCPPKP